MEILRRHVSAQPTRYAAYVALQVALMRRFLARGGTLEEFCARLAPIFHRRFGPALLGDPAAPLPACLLTPCSPRLQQEYRRLNAPGTTTPAARKGREAA